MRFGPRRAALAVLFLLVVGAGVVRLFALRGTTPAAVPVVRLSSTELVAPPTLAKGDLASPPPLPTATAIPLPDRTDCEQIRGSAYRSDEERAFFVSRCVPTPLPTAAATRPPLSTPVSSPVVRVSAPSLDTAPTATATRLPSATALATSMPVVPSNGLSGLTLTSLTGSVRPGQAMSLTFQGPPGARCMVAFTKGLSTASQNPGAAQLLGNTKYIETEGLEFKTPDASGRVAMGWSIDATSIAGTGSVMIFCGDFSASGSFRISA
jgi:hypothetical protein